MENTTSSSSKKAIISVAIIVIVIAVILALPKKASTPEITIDTATTTPVTKETDGSTVEATTSTTQPATEVKPTAGQTASVYNDGTYSGDGTYRSPAGTENVSVTLTLKDDVITAVTATPTSDNNTSKRYQAMFVSEYKALVLGKNIDSVKLDKVSGSSLTGTGFNAALSAIKTKARS